MTTKCQWFIAEVTNSNEMMAVFHLFFVIIPMLMPVLPIIVSCVISVVALIQSIRLTKCEQKSSTSNKKQVTLTIIILTIVYTVFNVPSVITVILYSFALIRPNIGTLFYFDIYSYYNNFHEIICVGINAVVNPIVYFIFMPIYKNYILQFFKLRC